MFRAPEEIVFGGGIVRRGANPEARNFRLLSGGICFSRLSGLKHGCDSCTDQIYPDIPTFPSTKNYVAEDRLLGSAYK